MKKFILLALFVLLATPVLADTSTPEIDLAPLAWETEALTSPVLADSSCGATSQAINLAPLAWEIDLAAGGFSCGGSCFTCTMCCNAACGWLDPCNEACWQANCASSCP